MSERILFPPFRNEQGASRYPFTDASTLRAAETTFTIDPACFIDASFYPIGGGDGIYLYQVIVSALNFEFLVRTLNPSVIVRGVYDWRNPPANGIIDFYDDYGRPAGTILVDKDQMQQFSSLNSGTYSFTASTAQFVATTFIPAKEPGVRAIRSVDGAAFFTGDIWLLGDDGVVVRAETDQLIRIDIVGVPLYRRVACDASVPATPPRFLKTINGCPPDEFGNFTITSTEKGLPAGRDDTVVRIYPTDAGLVFEAVGGGNV